MRDIDAGEDKFAKDKCDVGEDEFGAKDRFDVGEDEFAKDRFDVGEDDIDAEDEFDVEDRFDVGGDKVDTGVAGKTLRLRGLHCKEQRINTAHHRKRVWRQS